MGDEYKNEEVYVTDHGLSRYGSRITNHRSRITDHPLRITDYRLRITNLTPTQIGARNV